MGSMELPFSKHEGKGERFLLYLNVLDGGFFFECGESPISPLKRATRAFILIFLSADDFFLVKLLYSDSALLC